MKQTVVDVIIIGAGGAGMMCALTAGGRGRRVLILDHAKKLGGKILISGGGRCNFTNLGARAENYVSENSHFCKSALSRFTPSDFIQMVNQHQIAFHEKKLGQLFCDGSAQSIVELLKSECDQAGVEILLEKKIHEVARTEMPDGALGFLVQVADQTYLCESLVVATGGLSIPKLGATGFGYQIAEQFGLKLISRAAALDGFTFRDEEMRSFSALSGLSVDCVITSGEKSFRENILFTHSGLSGPAALQASLHWRPGQSVTINLLPERNALAWLMSKKKEGNRSLIKNLLSELLPSRFSTHFIEFSCANQVVLTQLPIAQIADRELEALAQKLHGWILTPGGTVGYSKAEVTRGGVNTDELSSKTMEAKKVPGLYFIGEVVDVTGWLGGYNFQWAWSSGWAAGQVV